jgi:hypothetical protein
MLTKLRVEQFKNFKQAELALGPLTLLVGANASGKSNLRDAFRFLHGIGRGYTLADIIDEKYGRWRDALISRGGGRGGRSAPSAIQKKSILPVCWATRPPKRAGWRPKNAWEGCWKSVSTGLSALPGGW